MILDSNILIYSVTADYQTFLSPYVNEAENSVSLITKLEVMGFHRLTELDKKRFERIFSRLTIFPIPEELVEVAISLRQQKSMSLGDAIVAATALEHKRTLVTRNSGDFKWIDGLKLVNPFDG